MSASRTVSEIFSVKEWRDLETGGGVIQDHWKWRRSLNHIDYEFLVVCHCIFRPTLYLVPCVSYLTLKDNVTLKSGLEVTEAR